MELPRSLAPWASILNLFDYDVALALGPLVRRVAAALGRLENHATSEGDEPDGLDGVARRGPYERLMLSELAVAEEYPEEFLRRAAMGEHLFYRLALRSPVRSRMSVALFDAGPNQIGSPRLAHLAALVALDRRAEAAGAQFGWGVLQRSDRPFYEGVTAAGVGRLLDSRSPREATAGDVETWRAQFAGHAEIEDFWLVGGSRIGRLDSTSGLSRIEISDPCDPESRRLDLVVRVGSSSPRALELELPEDAACARLLRDPFSTAVASPATLSKTRTPQSNLFFDPSGTKLFALGPRGGVIAYPVPNSPRAGVGNPRFYASPQGARAIAVGRAYRSIFVASVRGKLIYLDYFGSRRGAGPMLETGYYEIDDAIDVSPRDGVLGTVHIVAAEPSPRGFVWLPSGVMIELERRPSDKWATVDGLFICGGARIAYARVLASATIHSRMVFVGGETEGGPIMLWSIGKLTNAQTLSFLDDASQAFIGHGGGLSYGEFGLTALKLADGRWAVMTADGAITHHVEDGKHVVGVGVRKDHRKAGLITIAEDRRTIEFHGSDSREQILTATAPIVEVAMSTAGPELAYSTEHGDISAWSIGQGAELCRFTAKEGA
jgi:hypothetical protein